jgi:protein-disulfide isomerase
LVVLGVEISVVTAGVDADVIIDVLVDVKLPFCSKSFEMLLNVLQLFLSEQQTS